MSDRMAPWMTSGLLALLVVVGALFAPERSATTLAAAGVGVVAALFVRPSGRLGVVAAGVVVLAVGVETAESAANLGWFALCIVVAWAALTGGLGPVIVLAAVSYATLAASWLTAGSDEDWAPWFAGVLLSAVVARLVRRERVLTEQLRAAQAALVERAASEERARIARELHDVIGHALTVSLMHVTSARLALDEEPAEADRSLAEAERLARRSLEEVRAAVGLMRSGADGDGSTAPMPGLDRVADLVESFWSAGTRVDCEIVGDADTLTTTGGLTVYRILQEALTNVARHAPGSAATVRVEISPAGTRVLVDSDARPVPGRGDGSGLQGMRERAEALGGTLSAGPSGSGWRVDAELPA